MLTTCSLQLLPARLLAVAAEAVAALVWCGGGGGHLRIFFCIEETFRATTCAGGGGEWPLEAYAPRQRRRTMKNLYFDT